MAGVLDQIVARLAWWHAGHVYGRFRRTLDRVAAIQQRTLQEVLRVTRGSAAARRFGLQRVRSSADLRRAVPLQTYEDIRPDIERVMQGEAGALFAPGTPIRMFATSSGTTSKPKLVPVTDSFVAHYRRGWNTFGLKLLRDHPDAILRSILQSTGRMDASRAPSGVPCGAITGLLARTQKRIVRRYYVGGPELAEIDDPLARAYTLMRLALQCDVAFCITANPSTLIRLAETVDRHAEDVIRDVRDGALAAEHAGQCAVTEALRRRLRPDSGRARELERVRAANGGALRPRDYWRLSFLACWTGGSMGHYLSRLADWYGPIPVRDIGLLASEGRVSIPTEDGIPAGALDLQAACFEFIPEAEAESATPITVTAEELRDGERYVVVLTNHAGLLRYRLDDVVEVRGFDGGTPRVAFLYRAGRVSSLAGEKLTENQAVEAVRKVCEASHLPYFDFVLAPVWDDPPYYRLNVPGGVSDEVLRAVDGALGEANDEYASRRNSMRLGMLQSRMVGRDAIARMDRELIRSRGATAEQYKRPSLMTSAGEDDRLLAPPAAG